jgi:hypothetical protein
MTPSAQPAAASSILSSRELERQTQQHATRLQGIARPEEQTAIVEENMRTEAPTPQAVKQYYQRIAASLIGWEGVRDRLGDGKRGKEGMLFGSELVEDGEERRWPSQRNDPGQPFPTSLTSSPTVSTGSFPELDAGRESYDNVQISGDAFFCFDHSPTR